MKPATFSKEQFTVMDEYPVAVKFQLCECVCVCVLKTVEC